MIPHILGILLDHSSIDFLIELKRVPLFAGTGFLGRTHVFCLLRRQHPTNLLRGYGLLLVGCGSILRVSSICMIILRLII